MFRAARSTSIDLARTLMIRMLIALAMQLCSYIPRVESTQKRFFEDFLTFTWL